jgi:amidophosphoribosyltransferase
VAPGEEVSKYAYLALYALQHRGQEAAGIAAAHLGGNILTLRDTGLVSQVFDQNALGSLDGDLAIGHVRYSTTGSSAWENAQPVYRADRREIALAHNGNLTQVDDLRAELTQAGVELRSTSDTELMAAMLSTHESDSIEDAVCDVVTRIKGAFSTVVMTEECVVAFRDPLGLRPLVLGMIGENYCVASESCALDIMGATFLRDVEPGEVVTIVPGAIRSRMAVESERKAFCVFEYIYFARPDSRMNGTLLQAARGRMGEILAREAPVEADLVISVPDSGTPAARGYARASGIPQDDGFVKNRYVARTFIQRKPLS